MTASRESILPEVFDHPVGITEHVYGISAVPVQKVVQKSSECQNPGYAVHPPNLFLKLFRRSSITVEGHGIKRVFESGGSYDVTHIELILHLAEKGNQIEEGKREDQKGEQNGDQVFPEEVKTKDQAFHSRPPIGSCSLC